MSTAQTIAEQVTASGERTARSAGISMECRGLTRSFDRGLVQALRGADLSIERGERVAIVGRTGCGKSTLLALLGLLDEPDGGELRIDGAPAAGIRSPEAWRAQNVGFVFQFHHLLLHLHAGENLELPLLGRRDQADRRALSGEMLARLSLGNRCHTLAANLSGGERQLLAVGRALIHRPRLVLADEPTGSVDSATGRTIVAALLDWSRLSGGTLVVVTHDPQLAHALDRTVTMEDGRVVSDEVNGC